MNDNNTILLELHKEVFGISPTIILPIGPSGSNRKYYRLSDGVNQSVIGVIGENVAENEAFIYLSKHFSDKNLPVPKVIAVSDDRLAYLQLDLGDTSLFDLIMKCQANGCYDEQTISLLEDTMRSLADFNFLGAQGLDYSICYPLSEFDERTVYWDLNYFKYCFLKLSGIDFNELDLENDFKRLADGITDNNSNTFMYRDCQSRNIMVCENTPYFIDFQGGRRGPYEYDVASFLWQARAKYPNELRERLINAYLSRASHYIEIDKESFVCRLYKFVLFRLLQVLGAYGFRGIHEKKSHFKQSIVPALDSLLPIVKSVADEYPVLCSVVEQAAEKYNIHNAELSDFEGLTVTVQSFSYKKGLPEDSSGNGGGFVFDCRGMHNPGRYDEYKTLTGRDSAVIEFLEECGEVQTFVDSALNIIKPSITTYLRRGFTSLMVSFGCTGGQHRSVYCAEHVATLVKEIFPEARVRLIHREQNIDELL